MGILLPLSAERQSGFTLLQMTVFVTIIGLLAVTLINDEDIPGYASMAADTHRRMAEIEKAAQSFMLANGRRPCPSDATIDINAANSGREGATPGTCTGGTPAANFAGSGGSANIVAGGVPTAALGLADTYAFDGFGRRITYMVDKRATLKKACLSLQGGASPLPGQAGDIAVYNTVDPAPGTLLTNAIWALISYGQNAHGAFTMEGQGSTGGSVGNRMQTGNTNADTLNNAFVDSGFSTAFTKNLVKKERNAAFDDIVWYNEATKNTCCEGAVCRPSKSRLENDSGGNFSGVVAVGDINGDGIQDVAFSMWSSIGRVFVLFGRRAGWPDTAAEFFVGANELIDGVNGFIFEYPESNAGAFGASLAIADMNNDGKDDIIIGAPFSIMVDASHRGGVFVVYGRSGWPSATNTLDINFLADSGSATSSDPAVYGYRIDGDNWWDGIGRSLAVGNLNGDAYKDLVIGGYHSNNTTGNVTVIYGKSTLPGGTWPVVTGISNGYLNAAGGMRWDGAALDDYLGSSVAVGDTNGDGLDDLLIGASGTGGNQGAAFLLWGGKVWPASPQTLNNTFLDTGGTANYGFRLDGEAGGIGLGSSAAFADINGDGKKEIIVGAGEYSGSLTKQGAVYALWGKAASGWPNTGETLNLNLLAGVGSGAVAGDPAVNGFRLTGETAHLQLGGCIGEQNGCFPARSLAAGNVNKDGYADLLIGGYSNPSSSGGEDMGFAYVVYGLPASSWTVSQTLNTSFLSGATRGFRLEGQAEDDGFGFTLASGDINADSRPDIIVGAWKTDQNGNTNAGSAYLFFGRPYSEWGATNTWSSLQ